MQWWPEKDLRRWLPDGDSLRFAQDKLTSPGRSACFFPRRRPLISLSRFVADCLPGRC